MHPSYGRQRFCPIDFLSGFKYLTVLVLMKTQNRTGDTIYLTTPDPILLLLLIRQRLFS